MTFDFLAHELAVDTSDGARRTHPAQRRRRSPTSTRALMETLREMGIETRIWTMPVEFPIRSASSRT